MLLLCVDFFLLYLQCFSPEPQATSFIFIYATIPSLADIYSVVILFCFFYVHRIEWEKILPSPSPSHRCSPTSVYIFTAEILPLLIGVVLWTTSDYL